MSSLARRAPVRHGTCRLSVCINDTAYNLSPIRRAHLPSGVLRAWRLVNLNGPRAGAVRVVCRLASGINECSCPDYCINGARCKHTRALVAAGLLSARRRRPSEGGGR